MNAKMRALLSLIKTRYIETQWGLSSAELSEADNSRAEHLLKKGLIEKFPNSWTGLDVWIPKNIERDRFLLDIAKQGSTFYISSPNVPGLYLSGKSLDSLWPDIKKAVKYLEAG